MKVAIICSAILVYNQTKYVHQPKNIDLGFVVCGRRHHNCIQTLSLIDIKWKEFPYIQGFLTSDDNFVDRVSAVKIAFDCGQIKEIKDKLFSEDLY